MDIKEYREEFLKATFKLKGKNGKEQCPESDQLAKKYFGNTDIDSCIRKAYDDLKRNLRGIGKFSRKEELKQSICKIIKTRIEESKGIDSQTGFDGWHKKTCEEIICKANSCGINSHLIDGVTFSYGIAQKWLNMTLKYLIIIEKSDGLPIRFFHVPIDRYILKSASLKESDNCYALKHPIAPKRNGNNETDYFSENNTQPWSKFDCKQYDAFQSKLRKALKKKYDKNPPLPIEWEVKAWICQAFIEKGLSKK